jgi:hypothetical protein
MAIAKCQSQSKSPFCNQEGVSNALNDPSFNIYLLCFQ